MPEMQDLSVWRDAFSREECAISLIYSKAPQSLPALPAARCTASTRKPFQDHPFHRKDAAGKLYTHEQPQPAGHHGMINPPVS